MRGAVGVHLGIQNSICFRPKRVERIARAGSCHRSAEQVSRSRNQILGNQSSGSVTCFRDREDEKDDKVENDVVGHWDSLPPNRKISVGLFAAFMLCNLDKVNISIAIIPMAAEFGWGPSVAGLVQSSFFWGLLLFQIPGGVLCSRFGGRRVMPMGFWLWSLSTAGIPFWAGTIPGICLSRAAVGLGEATAPSAATDMVARIVPKEERSRTISFIFGGLHVGSILGLLIIPSLINWLGWPAIFLISGALGLAWMAWFEKTMSDIRESNPTTYAALAQKDRKKANVSNVEAVPWRAVFRSRPVHALAFAHFCTNWLGYSMMAWLPSYITSTLQMDIAQAARVSLLPPVAGFLCGLLSGQLADSLISTGWKTSTVRKLIQSIAYLFPAASLLVGWASGDAAIEVGCVALAIGFASFCMGGLYSNHQDLSLKYSSFLLGLTNTAAAIPGVLGVWLTGHLYETTADWHISLFAPTVVMMLLGTAVYLRFGSSSPQLFQDNSPLFFEKWIRRKLERTQ